MELTDAMGTQPPSPLSLVRLPALMALTCGHPEIRIGLIDGPVARAHPEFSEKLVPMKPAAACRRTDSAACRHGTFVAGVLAARRHSFAPAICPQCTLLVRPIFPEAPASDSQLPLAGADDLTAAIYDCIQAGARILNLSVALGRASRAEEGRLTQALGQALASGVVVVAAAGNQGAVSSTVITRHPATIPVVAYDCRGRPMDNSNIGLSIGRNGLGAPGDHIVSLGTRGKPVVRGGTSAAAPFVSGAAALLWSLFPAATSAALRAALTGSANGRRKTVVPPMLDAWRAYELMRAA